MIKNVFQTAQEFYAKLQDDDLPSLSRLRTVVRLRKKLEMSSVPAAQREPLLRLAQTLPTALVEAMINSFELAR